MNVKEYIKTNWKIIVIILLALFSLSKCTSSCSNKQKVKKLTTELVQHDSTKNADFLKLNNTIRIQNDSIKYLNVELNNIKQQEQIAKETATHYAEFSSDKYRTVVNENNSLKNENRRLNNKVTQLTKELQECKSIAAE
jgi:hypothetical protein